MITAPLPPQPTLIILKKEPKIGFIRRMLQVAVKRALPVNTVLRRVRTRQGLHAACSRFPRLFQKDNIALRVLPLQIEASTSVWFWYL